MVCLNAAPYRRGDGARARGLAGAAPHRAGPHRSGRRDAARSRAVRARRGCCSRVATGRPLFAGVVASGARRRVLPRRPHDAGDLARAGGVLRIGRAAAGLHAPAPLSAIRRAGVGDRRRSGGVGGGRWRCWSSSRRHGSRIRSPRSPASALIAAGIWVGSRERPVGIAAGALRRIARPSGEPFEDTAALGPFAMLLAHTVIARAERGAAAAVRGSHRARPTSTPRPSPDVGVGNGRRAGQPVPPSRSSSCSASRFSMRGGCRRRSRRSCCRVRRVLASSARFGRLACRAGARTRCAPSSPC